MIPKHGGATTPSAALAWIARTRESRSEVMARGRRRARFSGGFVRQGGIRLLRRRFHHIAQAIRHRRLIRNWAPIVVSYTGLRNLHDGATIELASGLRFAIAHSSDAWTILQVIGQNYYRVRESEPWRTVIDIGANIGTFAVLAARAAPGARVLCFEPAPDAAALLLRNVTMNGVEGRVVVEERAVAGTPGRVDLVRTTQSSMRRLGPAASAGDNTISVEAVTLGEIFEKHAVDRCDFLKIDCEGAEFELLRACPSSVLDRVDRIALEFHEWQPGDTAADLHRLLSSQGFRVEHVHDTIDPDVGYLFADRNTVS
ncbi:MAG: FkbM family methyltransferase [Vicinamibacterales bacterium]